MRSQITPVGWNPTDLPIFSPPDIRTVKDTGLTLDFLSDLALRIIYYASSITAGEVARRIGLPFGNVVERVLENLKRQLLVEVTGGASVLATSYTYTLTEKGYNKAAELVARTTYAGIAPVPMDRYFEAVKTQSILGLRVSREEVSRAFSHLVLPRHILDMLGPAINSGRSIFLFGESGNGKTSIAETVARIFFGGYIWVPYAVEFDGEIIKVYDPAYHFAVDPETFGLQVTDGRWVLCRRPAVVVGGELTMAQLDLTYSEATRYYEAPIQVRANGGILVIDDFGRQQLSPRDLLNRWIVPLERREDFLSLRSGRRLRVPFDPLVIFSTNMEPTSLVDEAFLRRIRYKIYVPDPTPESYIEILRRVCTAQGISFDPQAVELIFAYYRTHGISPRACHPRDIVEHLVDIADYAGVPPTLSPELLRMALESYFVPLSGRQA